MRKRKKRTLKSSQLMGISTHIYILRSWLWRRFKKLWIHGNERTNSKYSNSSKRLLFPQTQNTSCTLHVHAHTHSHINWVLRSLKRIVPWSFRRLLIFSIAFSKYFVLFFFATLWSIYCFFSLLLLCMYGKLSCLSQQRINSCN